MYQRNEGTWKNFPQVQKADYGREDGIAGYAWMSRYTVQFLDAYLKHDAAAMAYLKKTPAENGVPQHFLSVTYRTAKSEPATLDGFRTALNRQGFDHAAEIYAAMQKEDAGFKLEKDFITGWANDLTNNGHCPEAIALLNFNLTLNPNSQSVNEALGDAYLKSGQKELAIESYKKAHSRDTAKQKLQKLESSTTNPNK